MSDQERGSFHLSSDIFSVTPLSRMIAYSRLQLKNANLNHILHVMVYDNVGHETNMDVDGGPISCFR